MKRPFMEFLLLCVSHLLFILLLFLGHNKKQQGVRSEVQHLHSDRIFPQILGKQHKVGQKQASGVFSQCKHQL